MTLEECLERFKEAVGQGLLKIMSKMGISIISSYRGGYNFEAVGLSRSLCAEYFPGLITRISGIGLAGISNKVLALHRPRLRSRTITRRLRSAGSTGSERVASSMRSRGPRSTSCSTRSPPTAIWPIKKYSAAIDGAEPVALRDLIGFDENAQPVCAR